MKAEDNEGRVPQIGDIYIHKETGRKVLSLGVHIEDVHFINPDMTVGIKDVEDFVWEYRPYHDIYDLDKLVMKLTGR